jgi:hypothetical protein
LTRRLDEGTGFNGVPPGFHPKEDRVPNIAGLRIMMRQQFRLGFRQLGQLNLERFRRSRMQLAALLEKEAVMRRLLHQGMLEDIGRVGHRAVLKDQLGPHQFLQPGPELLRGQAWNFREQSKWELSADDGAVLSYALCRAELIEPGHQRASQRDRQIEHDFSRGPARAVLLFVQGAWSEDRFGQLLDMQGDAIGPLHNLFQHDLRKRLASRHVLDHRHAVVTVQPIKGDRRCVRGFRPSERDMLVARSHQQQDAGRADAFPNQIEQLARAWIHPVHIFDQRK